MTTTATRPEELRQGGPGQRLRRRPVAVRGYVALILLLALALAFPAVGTGGEVHRLRTQLAGARADLRTATDVADELGPPDAFGSGGSAAGLAGAHRTATGAEAVTMAVQARVRAADRRVREAEARLQVVLADTARATVLAGLLEQVRSLVPPPRDPETAGRLVAPLRGIVTSGFGPRRLPSWDEDHMHEGIDLFAPDGTSVGAAAAGQVIFAGWRAESGLSVIVEHAPVERGVALHTVYSHLSVIEVSERQHVRTGDPLGAVGTTGSHSTGPHLHFEVRVEGEAVDPRAWL